MKRKDIPEFGALSSLKVVIAATAIAGPVPGVIMAEMGADVIVIENPKFPDMYRYFKYGWPTERRNVRTLAMDTFSENGRETFVKLIKDADIFIESSKAGTWAKKGFTDEVLWEINPALVIAHITGFGLYGDPEWVKQGSYDNNGQYFSGYVIIQGQEGKNRQAHALPSDYYTAYTTLYSVLAAYIKAKETGKGDSLDIAQYEATLRPQHYIPGTSFNTGVSSYTMQTNDTPPATLNFLTKDEKWVLFAPIPTSIPKFLEMMGLVGKPGIPEKPTMMTQDDAWYQEQVYDVVKAFVAEHTAAEVEQIAKENSFSFCQALDHVDMPNHPHYKARNALVTYYDDTLGQDYTSVAPVPKFAKNPQQIWRGGYKTGADNEDILEELGYTAEQIQAFYDKGDLKKQV